MKVTAYLTDTVRVKLNDKGRKILAEELKVLDGVLDEDIIRNIEDHMKPDENGYQHFSFWKFMELFGGHLDQGNFPPFEAEFIIDK